MAPQPIKLRNFSMHLFCFEAKKNSTKQCYYYASLVHNRPFKARAISDTKHIIQRVCFHLTLCIIKKQEEFKKNPSKKLKEF